jgi:phage anti-repressor protein
MDTNALRTAIAHDAIRNKAGVDSGYLTREDIARRHLGRGMTFAQVLDVVHQALDGFRATLRATVHSPPAPTESGPERASTGTGLAVLLPLENATLEGAAVPTVDARPLHAWLGVGRDFSNWIKGRIDTYGFVEGEDFVTESRSPNRASGKRGASIEYHLTLGMAKELAMIENNDRGREARRYFIRCEQAARTTITQAGSVPSMAAFGGMMKVVTNKALVPLVARQDFALERQDAMLARQDAMLARMEAMEARLAAVTAPAMSPAGETDGTFLTARGAVRMAGGIGNMRRLVQLASASLRRFCAGVSTAMVRSDDDGRWLFDAGAVRAWLDAGGRDRLRLAL